MNTQIIILLFVINFSCKSQHHKTETMQTGKNIKEIREKGYALKAEDTIMMRIGKLDLKVLRQKYLNEGTTGSINDISRILNYFQYENTFLNGIICRHLWRRTGWF